MLLTDLKPKLNGGKHEATKSRKSKETPDTYPSRLIRPLMVLNHHLELESKFPTDRPQRSIFSRISEVGEALLYSCEAGVSLSKVSISSK